MGGRVGGCLSVGGGGVGVCQGGSNISATKQANLMKDLVAILMEELVANLMKELVLPPCACAYRTPRSLLVSAIGVQKVCTFPAHDLRHPFVHRLSGCCRQHALPGTLPDGGEL